MKRLLLPALLLLLALSPRAAADPFYFAVVNYTVSAFDSEHRPWVFDQVLLIPHTVLTGEDDDTSNLLGIRAQWSAEDRLFTLFNNSKQLTFEYGYFTAYSGSERYTAPVQRTIDNGRMVFSVPIDLVCSVFGFTWGETPTEWGTMVRICNENGRLSDERYIKNRAFQIQEKYDEYIDSKDPPLPGPSPDVSAPLPTMPTASPSPSAPQFSVAVTLTFDGAPNDVTGRILDLLEREGLPAIFFVPPENLADDLATIRRITARQQIGLLLDVPDGEALPDAIREGNERLRQTAFIKTWLLRAANAPAEDSGHRWWDYTVRFGAEDTDILTALEPLLQKTSEPSSLVISLPHSEAALAALTELPALLERNENLVRRVNPW